MKVTFQLLDATYEVRGRQPVVVLWGKDENNETIVLLDKRFRPYFYVLPEKEEFIEILKTKILGLNLPRSPVISIEPCIRKLFGRPVKVLKVTTVIPDSVRDYRERVKELPGVKDVLEADVRFAFRYMIDKDVKPFRWYTVEVKEITDKTFRAKKVYEILEDPVEIEKPIKPPELTVVAFDIEVYNPAGSPRPTKDPVIIIGLLNGGFKQLVSSDKSDTEIIRRFVEEILTRDPDIITGYNINRFDWLYLLERAKLLNIKLDLTRKVGAEPTPSVHGHISVQGRLNVDLYDFAEEIPEIKRKTLEEVAEYFGVMKSEEREHVEWYEIPKLWDSGEEGRKKLLLYNKHDVESTYGLAKKFLPFGIQLSSLTGIPLDQVMAASVGFRLEFYLMRQAYKHGELIPNRPEKQAESYKGAIVLKPKPGVHENIVVLDFTSMYPSIMIKYNVGPDTLIRDPNDKTEAYVAPDVGHRFRKEPPGFFKTVLQTLVSARKKIREQLKKIPRDSPEYEVLNERQRAMKLLANATYGYMGWQMARWYCRECAEAVTAWGRHNILSAIKKARELGLEVIYGDTDSLFVRNDEKKVKEFIEWVEKELGFEIKVDKIYKRVFFTEAKKRYIGLTIDGHTDIVGFEAVRGDWAEIAKEIQFEIAKRVLEEGKTSTVVEYVRNFIKKLREGEVPLEKLVIWKTLTKNIDEYEVEAPHVRAARKYIEAGIKVSKGDKIGYVIVKGSGKISDRAMPYFMVKKEDVDVDYYIDHQIIPAALRILEYFGISEATLKSVATGRQRSLFDFLKKN